LENSHTSLISYNINDVNNSAFEPGSTIVISSFEAKRKVTGMGKDPRNLEC